MHIRCCIVALSFVCLLQLSLVAQKATVNTSVKIGGDVTKPFILTAGAFAKMPQVSATAKDHDGIDRNYKGVAVSTILQAAGATTSKQLRGKNLAKYLLVKCADAYQVIFSPAELDADFTDRVVVLANEMDGKPLPEGKGPYKLIVPGEKKPARSCLMVTEFVIGAAR